MKITIIGSSGSGKSTLARKISTKFSIPRIEIDRIWFKHDGHKYLRNTDTEQKEIISQKIHAEVENFLSSNESWVIDGTYTKIQPQIAKQADVVILIKRNLIKRVWSHIARICKGEDRHSEVTKMQDIFFIKTIVRRWIKGEDTKLDEFVKPYSQKLVVLKSFHDIDRYFETFNLNV